MATFAHCGYAFCMQNACGAFPIRVGDEWVATIAVSGYMEGLDHEVILRALEQVLEAEVPRWDASVT